MEQRNFRSSLSAALDPQMRPEIGLSILNQVVVALICASILIGIAQTEPLIYEGHEGLFALAHASFFMVFLLEYAGRLYVAALNPRYRTGWRYARTPAAMLDLAVLVSFVLPLFGLETALLRMFRAARLIRLARLGRYSKAMSLITEAVAERRYELGVSVVIASGLMLLSATALYLAEGSVQPDNFGSIPRAMWWSVATLTTVGYGDIVPITGLGRLFASVTALTGVGIIAIPTGILAGAFGEALRKARSESD